MSWWLAGPVTAGGHLEWTSPQHVVLLAAGAAVLAWALSLAGRRPWWLRLAEATAWAGALAGAVVALARPVWVVEEGHREEGRVAVLVDASRSMAIQQSGTPRYEAVEEVLRQVGGDVDLYHFGGDLSVGLPGSWDQPSTDIEAALSALSERVAGERLAGVVLITDGLDRGLLRRRFQREERPRPPELPGPLTVYQVGSAGDVRDLAVRSVDSGGFAFLRADFTLSARIEGVGMAGRRVRVLLTRDGAPVTEQRVLLDDRGQAEVEFTVRPEAAGRFAYAVEVPVYEDDAIPTNNAMPVVVEVVRDRIRVLQVAGKPTWDVKFLRRFLKGDPSVDLVSFFILRTNEDMDAGYGDSELALIPFPYRDLFTGELRTFDVVVFHNFDYRPYFDAWRMGAGRALLENVRRYVADEGGALVMVGGDRSFDLGEYAGTPLESALPVELGRTGDLVDPEPFSPVLTEEGARHPVTRLVAVPEENQDWWARLHPLDGANLVARPAPGSAVLLVHPSATDLDGDPAPLLAVREVGEGRTMALAIDSSWRWSFSEAAEGRGNQAYLRFWKNAVRWLVQDPTAGRVTVETPRENYGVGDDVRIVVRARDAGFAPLRDAEVEARVDVGGETLELTGVTGADGEAVLELPAAHRGAHRVRAEVTRGGAEVGEAGTVYAVTTRDPEVDEVDPDAEFLRWLAESTDGRYVGPGEEGPVLRDPEAGRTRWERQETPLWRAPALAAWIALMAGVAWVVRRRSGLR